MTRSLHRGGAERQLAALAIGLHRRGHSVAVLAFYPGGPLESELTGAGVQVRIFNKKGRWDVFGFPIRLLMFLRRAAPDILHGYLVVPNLLAAFFRPFLPGTKVVWGVRASDMDLSCYDWMARFTFSLSCMCARFADLIIANSLSGMVYHRERGYPREKTVIIPNGIDTERFGPSRDDRTTIRAEWGIGENEKLIGLVGRLDPMKDHPTFLKAAALFLRERGDVRFACVGGGPAEYGTGLRRMGAELGLDGRLLWAGERADAHAVYNAFDVATLSSVWGEGFPNVVGEAMSCGIPCVVTDAGDSPAIVGRHGIVVPSGNPQALAEAWGRALDCAAEFPDMESRGRIVREYSVHSLVERTERALLELQRGRAGC